MELGVEVLTLYTFSVENWQRPARRGGRPDAHPAPDPAGGAHASCATNSVRLQVIGRLDELPAARAQARSRRRMAYLAGSTGMLLNLALSYGGRAEIVDAVRRARRATCATGRLRPRRRRRGAVRAAPLAPPACPIPTCSSAPAARCASRNFLLWQIAYTEMWVTDTLWPDFRRRHLFEAVADYQGRERRFGRSD